MNYFSNTFFFILLVILPVNVSFALEIESFYLSSCKRELGVVVDVSTSYLKIFNLMGEVKSIPRFEVVGISSYPVDRFPVSVLKFKKNSKQSLYSIKTLYKNEITHLVNGWPIGFSKDKITILSNKGEEITFARNNIWEIEKNNSVKKYIFLKTRKRKYDFLHPTSLRNCSKRTYGKSKTTIKVSPQEYISDPVLIKRKLDSFRKELKIVDMYTRVQDFYSVPEVFKNQTTLGLWLFAGSRHGASNNRSNNWAPILENQFSSGPFGYQHAFLTGADTNSYFIHEEPQTQIYYKFKADYFHLSYFMDPTLILMGKRYRWFADELGKGEYRVNDMSFIEMGFDYGALSLILQVASDIQIGYKSIDNYFYDGSLSIPKTGIEYRNHLFSLGFLIGSADENVRSDDAKDANGNNIGYKFTNFKLDFLKLNYSQVLNNTWAFDLSYISRSLEVNSETTDTLIFASEVEYKYTHKYIFKLLISNERVEAPGVSASFIKAGLSANLVF